MNIKRSDSPSFVVAFALAAAFLLGTQLHSSAQAPVNFMSPTQVWKYYQAGDQPADDGSGNRWLEPGYNDSAWESGAAQLGFNEGDESTLLERGPITFYFRTTIAVTGSQLNQANQLLVNLLRDDGAVVYVNGVEIIRDNMPEGVEIEYDTLAISGVAGGDESTFFPFGFLLDFDPILEVGVNTIAVEVHQNSVGSSDVSFQMEMLGYSVIPRLGLWEPPVGITFELAGNGETEYSVRDYDPRDPFELGWYADASGFQSFVAPNLSKVGPPEGFSEGHCMVTSEGTVTLVTDIANTGSDDLFDFDPNFVEQAYRVNLSNYTDAAVQFGLRTYVNNGTTIMPNGASCKVWMYTSSDGTDFQETLLDEWKAAAADTNAVTLVADGATKKVTVPTAAIPGWETTGFNDASWTTGVKGAGYERSAGYDPYFGPTLDLESQLYGVNPSLYMRIPFTVADKSDYVGLQLCMRYDDGFVAYLNGIEVARANAPGGVPQWNSEASSTHADADAVVWQTFGITQHLDKLNNGANVLAIQGLNSPSTSSDMLTAVELKGLVISGGGGDGKRSLSEILGPLDGPFRTYKYNIPNNAQTVTMKWQMTTPSSPQISNVSAIFLDNILFTGTPVSVNSYSSWIQLNTDYELDDLGSVNADPEGDTIRNLLEYAFGGSAIEPDTGILPTVEIVDVGGTDRFVMTWRQLNQTAKGTLNGFGFAGDDGITGGYKVRDIQYVPQFSTDGINWEDGVDGPRAAMLFDSVGNDLPDGPLPEGEEDYINVSAYWVTELPIGQVGRVFGRVKILLDSSQYYIGPVQ